MDDKTKKEIQSATLERLVKHLDERKDVQNIDLMNLAGFFVEIVYLDGTEKKRRKKELLFLILMLESTFMECLTLNGKKNIRNNYFSFNRGNSSTKLQGLCLMSN